MLDLKWIRKNPKELDEALVKRGEKPIAEKVLKLDEKRRNLQISLNELEHAKNEKVKKLGTIQDKKSKEFLALVSETKDLNNKIDRLKSEDNNSELKELLDTIPNILEDVVPYGTDDTMNELIKTWGDIEKQDNPKDHVEIAEKLGMIDFKQTSLVSGSRFVTLSRDLARLERALIRFMLDIHTKKYDFVEVSPPYLVKDSAMYGAGQLPKFAEDSFETSKSLRLIPTSEVSLVNMVYNQIIPRERIPMRMVSYTPCFRSEAGAAGKDTRGMIRLHQFGKVELVSITTPDESIEEQNYLLSVSEYVLQELELPYRVMLLCSGDTGFCSTKTYDLEVWMPGQQKYREIASCSNCTDFQARRLKARYKEFGSNETTFVHTLNCSGLPIGRTMVAILENYQNSDNTVNVPKKLVEYMDGENIINPSKYFI